MSWREDLERALAFFRREVETQTPGLMREIARDYLALLERIQRSADSGSSADNEGPALDLLGGLEDLAPHELRERAAACEDMAVRLDRRGRHAQAELQRALASELRRVAAEKSSEASSRWLDRDGRPMALTGLGATFELHESSDPRAPAGISALVIVMGRVEHWIHSAGDLGCFSSADAETLASWFTAVAEYLRAREGGS